MADRHPLRKPVPALALGCALAAALAAVLWPRGGGPPTLDKDHERAEVQAVLSERLREPPAAPGEELDPADPRARPHHVPREAAKRLFLRYSRGQEYDPWSIWRHRPDLEHEFEWPEHPRGSWVYRTNGIGLREDQEVLEEQPDLRVLVTGDSHTEGFCDNRDTYPNLLERGLRRVHPQRTIEVLNAGDGGYSFHNHLGVLERFHSLSPDLFVVTVYGGNDFQELLLPYWYLNRVPRPEDTEDYLRDRQAAIRISRAACVQVFHSVLRFRHYPASAELALRVAEELMLEIQGRCEELGIRLLCVYLPPPSDVDWQSRAALYDRFVGELGLDPAELGIFDRLADGLLGTLEERGVATLDLRQHLVDGRGPYFWSEDHHLNLAGHSYLARALMPLVEPLLGSGGGPR